MSPVMNYIHRNGQRDASFARNQRLHHHQQQQQQQQLHLDGMNFYPVTKHASFDDFMCSIDFQWDQVMSMTATIGDAVPTIKSSHPGFSNTASSLRRIDDCQNSETSNVAFGIFDDGEAYNLEPNPIIFPHHSANGIRNPQVSVGQVHHEPLISPPISFSNKISKFKSEGQSEAESSLVIASAQDSRFKPFHEEKWNQRFKELVVFHREYGHAAVPHTYPPNQQLARWIKRQRRQYKLLQEGTQTTTLTPDRLEMLNNLGFIWDSHEVNWKEKFDALKEYKKEHGNCNVPSNFNDKKLATWVKCQRRQYKLFLDNRGSSMTKERIEDLNRIGFNWEIRHVSSSRKNTASTAAKKDAFSPQAPLCTWKFFSSQHHVKIVPPSA